MSSLLRDLLEKGFDPMSSAVFRRYEGARMALTYVAAQLDGAVRERVLAMREELSAAAEGSGVPMLLVSEANWKMVSEIVCEHARCEEENVLGVLLRQSHGGANEEEASAAVLELARQIVRSAEGDS